MNTQSEEKKAVLLERYVLVLKHEAVDISSGDCWEIDEPFVFNVCSEITDRIPHLYKINELFDRAKHEMIKHYSKMDEVEE